MISTFVPLIKRPLAIERLGHQELSYEVRDSQTDIEDLCCPEESSNFCTVENPLVEEEDRHLRDGQCDGLELCASKVDFVEFR